MKPNSSVRPTVWYMYMMYRLRWVDCQENSWGATGDVLINRSLHAMSYTEQQHFSLSAIFSRCTLARPTQFISTRKNDVPEWATLHLCFVLGSKNHFCKSRNSNHAINIDKKSNHPFIFHMVVKQTIRVEVALFTVFTMLSYCNSTACFNPLFLFSVLLKYTSYNYEYTHIRTPCTRACTRMGMRAYHNYSFKIVCPKSESAIRNVRSPCNLEQRF